MTEPAAYPESAGGVANEDCCRFSMAGILVVTVALAVMITRSETVETKDFVVLVVSVTMFVCVVKTVAIEAWVVLLIGIGYCRRSEQKD